MGNTVGNYSSGTYLSKLTHILLPELLDIVLILNYTSSQGWASQKIKTLNQYKIKLSDIFNREQIQTLVTTYLLSD